MTDNQSPMTPAQALAAAVARRKAAATNGGRAYPGARQSEQAASAHSASKSKPAMGK